jgi:hypothetical protein
VEAQYGDVLAWLNLPPGKLKTLKELILKRDDATDDSEAAARSAGETDRDKLKEIINEARNAVDEEIRTLLGEDDYARYKDARNLAVPYGVAKRSISPEMADAGVPMTSEQTVALARALYVGMGPALFHERSAMEQAVDPQTGLTQSDRNALTQASAILSPAQLEVLRRHLAIDSRFWDFELKAMGSAKSLRIGGP